MRLSERLKVEGIGVAELKASGLAQATAYRLLRGDNDGNPTAIAAALVAGKIEKRLAAPAKIQE